MQSHQESYDDEQQTRREVSPYIEAAPSVEPAQPIVVEAPISDSDVFEQTLDNLVRQFNTTPEPVYDASAEEVAAFGASATYGVPPELSSDAIEASQVSAELAITDSTQIVAPEQVAEMTAGHGQPKKWVWPVALIATAVAGIGIAMALFNMDQDKAPVSTTPAVQPAHAGIKIEVKPPVQPKVQPIAAASEDDGAEASDDSEGTEEEGTAGADKAAETKDSKLAGVVDVVIEPDEAGVSAKAVAKATPKPIKVKKIETVKKVKAVKTVKRKRATKRIVKRKSPKKAKRKKKAAKLGDWNDPYQ